MEILNRLQEPQPIGELRVETEENGRKRQLTREGVRHHVVQLLEAGLVEATTPGSPNGNMITYQARKAGLFHLSETLIQIAHPNATSNRPPTKTQGEPLNSRNVPTPSPWPRLAIVNGLGRGIRCKLEPAPSTGERGWVIGRDDACDVVIPYDENVAEQHAEIVQTDDGFKLVDFRTSGPTSLNWNPLERGDTTNVTSGDIIGVGSTLLVFQPGEQATISPLPQP